MAESDAVQWRVTDHIGRIVLNRPGAANAINMDLARGFRVAVDAMSSADIGAVLLSANGKRFWVGGDIHAFASAIDTMGDLIREVIDTVNPAILRLAQLHVPVVSALQGAVGGGGIGLGLCADVVLAASTMKLRTGYSAIGMAADPGSSHQLVRRIGAARTKALLLTNRALDADECQRWGVVDAVYPPEALQAEAENCARSLADGAGGALWRIKELCNTADNHDLNLHLKREREAMLASASSADAREGVRAFVEKRAPRFVKTTTA